MASDAESVVSSTARGRTCSNGAAIVTGTDVIFAADGKIVRFYTLVD